MHPLNVYRSVLLQIAMCVAAPVVVCGGPQTLLQPQIAEEAGLLALSPDGWDLASTGAALKQKGGAGTGWTGGPEYFLERVPKDLSGGLSGFDPPNPFGYALNDDALQYGSGRTLWFHTDNPAKRESHETGWRAGTMFGDISGNMDGGYLQTPVPFWGTFYVTPPADGTGPWDLVIDGPLGTRSTEIFIPEPSSALGVACVVICIMKGRWRRNSHR